MSSEEDGHDGIEQVGCSVLSCRLCTSVGRLLTLERQNQFQLTPDLSSDLIFLFSTAGSVGKMLPRADSEERKPEPGPGFPTGAIRAPYAVKPHPSPRRPSQRVKTCNNVSSAGRLPTRPALGPVR